MLKLLKNSTAYRYLQRSVLLKSFLLFFGLGLVFCGLAIGILFGLAPLIPAFAVAASFIAGKSIVSLTLAATVATTIYSTVCSLITKAVDLIKFPPSPNNFFSRILGKLGYRETEGICNGASHVMMQAYLTSHTTFKKTHENLQRLYSDNHDDVVKEELKDKHKKGKLENLFNRISIFQDTHYYLQPVLVDTKKEIDSQDAKVALSFAETKKIKAKGGIMYAKASNFVGQYTASDLKAYLRSFKQATLKAPKVALTLGASRHSTMLYYDRHQDTFVLFDINHEKLLFRGSAHEVAKHLHERYDSKNGRITMATNIFYLKKHNLKAELAIYRWKKSHAWQQLHQVNQDMLTSDLTTNENDQDNHSIFVKALIKSDMDMLIKVTLAHLSHETQPACLSKEKWDAFTKDFIDQSPDTDLSHPGLCH